MTFSLEVINSLERRMTITVAFQPLETEIEERLALLSREAEFEGYRPGKAPMHLVNKRYGDKLRVEIYAGSVEKSFGLAVEEKNLRVAGFPEIEHLPFTNGDTGFQYTATFEVFPEIVIGDFATVKIDRPVYKIGQSDVKKALDLLVKQRSSYQPVERAAKKGDRINLRIKASIEGKVIESTDASGIDFILGEAGRLASFDSQLVGAKMGSARQFQITNPADHQPEELAGKVVHYEFYCNSVAELVVPKIDADFSISIGVEDSNMETMKAKVAEKLQQELCKRISDKLKENVFQALLDSTDFELPRALVGAELNRVLEATEKDFKERGVESSSVNLDPAMFENQAKRTTKLRLVLNALINANNLHANKDQVHAKIEQMAKAFENPADIVTWYYAEDNRLDEARALASEENAIDWVLSAAKLTDKKMQFDELMGAD
jgi:trigger factor